MPDNSAPAGARDHKKRAPDPATADRDPNPDITSPPSPTSEISDTVERVAQEILASLTSARHRRGTATSPSTPSVVRLSEIEPEAVLWLSPGRLGIGKVTVLDGDPGLGKSTLLCDFAARITRGQPLPGGQSAPSRGVILLSAEDSLSDTIRPRIEAAGGDARRVVTLLSVPDHRRSSRPVALPGDALLLGELAVQADASLIIIDPLASFLGPRHTIADAAHLRHILTALRDIADLTNVAVVVVRHLNKASGANPLYRGGGSIGIIGAARCGLLLAADRDDPARRILAATKENLTVAPPSLAFRLITDPATGVARVAWDGESRWTANQLLNETPDIARSRSALIEARQWLRATLAASPLPSKTLQEEAYAHGHTERTLARARRAEGIVIRKQPGLHGQWTWELPPPPKDSAECIGEPG